MTLCKHIAEQFLSHQNLRIFIKDCMGRFLYCNESFAKDAEIDSPHQITNKTDHDMIWYHQAKKFQADDKRVLNGSALNNMLETQKDNVTVLTTKFCLRDEDNHPFAVGGYYTEITQSNILPKPLQINGTDVALTSREHEIMRHMILGYTSKQCAQALCLSPRTVEGHIQSIKNKLQCKTRRDLVKVAILNGLLFSPC